MLGPIEIIWYGFVWFNFVRIMLHCMCQPATCFFHSAIYS